MKSLKPLALFNASYVGRQPTGIGVVARDLAKSLDPSLVTILDPIEEFFPNNIDIPKNLSPENGTKGHVRRLLWTQTCLPKLLKKTGAEFLISPLPEAPLFRGVKSLVFAHDLIPLRYPQFSPLLAYHLAYVPLVLHRSVRIFCNSDATKKELNEYLKIPLKKIVKVPLGFDQKKIFSLNSPREPYFLVLGRHDPHKNIPGILKGFYLSKLKDFKLRFVGTHDPRYTPKYIEMAEELGISNQCNWVSWVSDNERLNLLNKCQGLIIASFWEGFGLPALEAMACNTPVIASSRGALPEVVDDSAFLIDPSNPSSIAEAMKELVSNNTLVKILVERGQKRLEKFSWRNTAEMVEKVLHEII